MKNILSLFIALAALFSVGMASAQEGCHQVDSKSSLTTSDNSITLTVKIAGLGNAIPNNTLVNYTLNGTLTADAIECVPNGQTKKSPGSDADGLESDLFDGLTGTALVRNGSITISVTAGGPCPNNNFDCRLINGLFSGSVTIGQGACNGQAISISVAQ